MAKAKKVLSEGDSSDDILQSIFKEVNDDAHRRGLPSDKVAVGFARDMAKKLRLPTGNPTMDWLLNGGWKFGSSNEIFGPPGGGKSTMCLETVVETSNNEEDPGLCLIIQAEEGDVKEQLELMGANMSRVVVFSARGSGQLAFEYLSKFLREDRARKIKLKLIIIDSLAALSPKSILERYEKDGQADAGGGIGEVSRMFADWYRDMHSLKLGEDVVILLVNQIRTKMNAYGASEDSYSGYATKHGPRTRIRVRAGEPLTKGTGENKRQIGHVVKVKMIKDGSTHIRQGTEIEYDAIYGKGNDKIRSLGFLLEELKGIRKAGAWVYPEERFLKFVLPNKRDQYEKWNGMAKLEDALEDSEEFQEAARAFILDCSMEEVNEKEDVVEQDETEEEDDEI